MDEKMDDAAQARVEALAERAFWESYNATVAKVEAGTVKRESLRGAKPIPSGEGTTYCLVAPDRGRIRVTCNVCQLKDGDASVITLAMKTAGRLAAKDEARDRDVTIDRFYVSGGVDGAPCDAQTEFRRWLFDYGGLRIGG